jgi:hypothetical protein
MSDSPLKYIIPKLNRTLLTDNFCVVGCNSSIGDDDNENPLFGNTQPLAYSYDGITFNPVNDRTLYYINKVDFNGYQWIACGFNVDNTRSLILSSDGINWLLPVNNVLPGGVIDMVWGKKNG